MYNDYSGYQPPPPPFDLSRGSPHGQNKTQYTSTPKISPPPIPCQTQPTQLLREFSEELSKRVSQHRKNKKNMVGSSIEMIKKKFEGENSSAPVSNNRTKSGQVIKNTLEESYWAQWKPTPTNTSSNWSDMKRESSVRGRSQFTACSNEIGPKLLDEKALKILRKPMDMVESNSSEGDKNIQGKMYLYNPCDEPVTGSEVPPTGTPEYPQTIPTFTMSMPNYHTVFYHAPEDHKYQERVKPFKRKEPPKPRCYNRDIEGNHHPRNIGNETQKRDNELDHRHPRADHNKMDHNIAGYNKADYNIADHDRTEHNRVDHNRADHNRVDHNRVDHNRIDHSRAHSVDPECSKTKRRIKQDKKRPKSLEKKQDKFKGKSKQTKSDEEFPDCADCGKTEAHKNRVRFFTKKHLDDTNDDEDTDSYGSLKESSRTVDGYHGDVDTESYQMRERTNNCCHYDDSYEEGQGDLETDTYDHMQSRCYHDEVIHEDMDSESYEYHCRHHEDNYYDDHGCFQNSEEDSFMSRSGDDYGVYHHSHMAVYRGDEETCYPNNRYNGRYGDPSSSDSRYNNMPQRDSSFSSTSKSDRGILKQREYSFRDPSLREPSLRESPLREPPLRQPSLREQSLLDPSSRQPSLREPSLREPPLRKASLKESSLRESKCKLCRGKMENLQERGCGTPSPAPKTASACNTDIKVCMNRSCETLDKITKEKKTGDDSPCCLKMIKEQPETISARVSPEVSSSSKSDDSHDPCKYCHDPRCQNASASSSSDHTSLDASKSSDSSRDTRAMAVDSSKDDIADADVFPIDRIDGKSTDTKDKMKDKESDTKAPSVTTASTLITPTKASTASQVQRKFSRRLIETTPSQTLTSRNATRKPSSGNATLDATDTKNLRQDFGTMAKSGGEPTNGSATRRSESLISYKSTPAGKPFSRDVAVGQAVDVGTKTEPGIDAGTGTPIETGTSPRNGLAVKSENGARPNNTEVQTESRIESGVGTEAGAGAEVEDHKTNDVDPLNNDPKQYDPKQYDSKQYDSKQYGPKQNNSKQYDPEPHDQQQHDPKQYDSKQYDPKQYDSKQYDAEQYDANASKSVKTRGTVNHENQAPEFNRSMNTQTYLIPETYSTSKTGLVHVHYDSSDNPSLADSKAEAPGDQEKSLPLARESSMDTALRHGRSFDGIRHYRSQENELSFRIASAHKNQTLSQADTTKNANIYSALGGPFLVMQSETRSSIPTMMQRSLIFQRAARCPAPNRIKGHTYTLKSPTGSGRTARSPKRKGRI